MFHLSFSIRKKITYGFCLLLFIMIGTAVLTYDIVRQVERKVVFVEVIDDFLHTTLEVRRFEKNYFLYQQEKDYQENLLYWQKLDELFRNNAEELRSLAIPAAEVSGLGRQVAEYKDVMERLHRYNREKTHGGRPRNRFQLEEAIRRAGKDLTDFAEKTSLAERRSIRGLLQATRNVLVVSIFCLVVVSVVIAAFLGRRVVNSLKRLEGYTKRISHGEFVEIAANEGEQEIRSLLAAFNSMTKELRMRQQQLVQSEKLAALGTLLSGVAHELNNPLSNISTSAQILTEEIEDKDLAYKKELLDQIEKQADKARDIVRMLLEFSRVKEFAKQKLPLRELIEETIVLIRGQVPSEVEIAVDIPGDLCIIVDKQRMQQVFLNLIKNGIDAVGPAGHLWVSAWATGDSGRQGEVEIKIKDNGPGIEPENVIKIFDPFFTTKDVGKGSGLGLSVAHEIVGCHGGTITVDSQPGQGTTFVIWLPGERGDA